jgi:hypothetical protein
MKRTTNPIREEEIPVLTSFEDGFESNGLRIFADGRPATCFITSAAYSSEKIVVLFDGEDDPKNAFTTKYFRIEKPGHMQWGHDGKVMKLYHAE